MIIVASQGHFEVNVFKPVIAFAVLQSVRLLAEAARSFTRNRVLGIRANEERITALMQRSLMLESALYTGSAAKKAAEIAKYTYANGTTLRAEAIRLGYICGDEFARIVHPLAMIGID